MPLPLPEFGLYKTHNATKPFSFINVFKLSEMANAPLVFKNSSKFQAVAQHNGQGKSKTVANVSEFAVIAIDHDKDDKTRKEIEALYNGLGVKYLAFTTSSHQRTLDKEGKTVEAKNRWKVVVPLIKYITAQDFEWLSKGIAHSLKTDPAQAQVQQILYSPTKLESQALYEVIIELGDQFDWLSPTDDCKFIELAKKGYEDLQLIEAKKRKAPIKPNKLVVQTRHEENFSEINEILNYISPSLGYQDWLTVLMGLHDKFNGSSIGLAIADKWSSQGNTYRGYEEIKQKWKSFNSTGVTFSSVAEMARQNGANLNAIASKYYKHSFSGSSAPLPEGRVYTQDVIERIRESCETKERFLSFTDLMNLPQQEWFIKDLLPAKGLGMLVGASGGGKTFLALYLLAMLSQGRDFLEMSSKKTPVIYLGLEGGSGIKNRMLAIQKHYNLTPDSNFSFILDGGFNLTNASDCIEFAQGAVKKVGKGCVICIDTLNQASAGTDENSGKDMGLIIQGLQTIQAITGGLVLAVHHLGKDRSRGARGHSSLYAACDVVLAATKQASDSEGWLSTSAQDGGKAKDAEPVSKPYNLSPVELDTKTPEGHIMTSAVATLGVGGAKNKELTGRAKEAENAYIRCLKNGKGEFKGKFLGLSQTDWKSEFVKSVIVNPKDVSDRGVTVAKSTAFTNGVKGLNAKKLITQNEDSLMILHTNDVSRIAHEMTQKAA